MRRDTFQAIADPTRRQILQMIAAQPVNINIITGSFEMSRTAVLKHIRILAECGLISVAGCGRIRYCVAQPDKLREVAEWLEQYTKSHQAPTEQLERYLKDTK
jgi:DNA-binding transcriptional ArsR family regulator